MRRRRWVRRAGLALLVLAVAGAGFSLLLRAGRVHRYITARLEAAFGRAVEVGRYDFSLIGGLRLEASYVRVAEDPRFGHEYFLRAERLTAGLRWGSLARGRFEFGTVSLTRPSLNLVRTADGHWNVESWLPPPAPAAGTAAAASTASPSSRLHRIEVETGRINFKQGPDKHPFALVDLKGVLEQESAGRWRMDLEARPFRTGVVLQEAGKLRARGRIAGTSARLRPAELVLTWQDASLADALRLARGQDYGVRGRLAAELTARTAAPGPEASRSRDGTGAVPVSGQEPRGPVWSFALAAQLEGIHRWDLARRPGDPALSLRAEAEWRPGEALLEISKCMLEAPRSSVRAVGKIQWAPALDSQVRLASPGIGFADLLAWYRAFRPEVAEDLAVDGQAEMELALRGWPPRLEQGLLASEGASLRTARLPGPIRVGRLTARLRNGRRARFVIEPTTLTLGPSATSAGEAPAPQARHGQAGPNSELRVEASLGNATGLSLAHMKDWRFDLRLAGQTDRSQDLLAAAAALGHTLSRSWSAEGPVGLHLEWQGNLRPFEVRPRGSIELRGLRLRTLYSNQPVNFTSARLELRPEETRLTLTAAQAFGAQWHGLVRGGPVGSAGSSRAAVRGVRPRWEFDLTADRLDVADLDRWLGPRARPGLLERLVPFAGASRASPDVDAALGDLRGQGRIMVNELVISPLRLRRLRAEAGVEGRSILLRRAEADFYGGRVRGSLDARLSPQPAYHIEAHFERVNVVPLTDVTAALKGRFAGSASGELLIDARGVGRESLLRSLEGRGTLHIPGARFREVDLKAAYAAGTLRLGKSQFAAAEARFALAAGMIQLERLRLTDKSDDFELEGSVAFSRALDLRMRRVTQRQDGRSASSGERIRITGPLDAPRITRLEERADKR